MNLEFNESDHTYKIDGRAVPSVTQVIGETVGHGWTAEQWYLDRGRAIHRCAEFVGQGKDFKYDERLAGYVAALRKFFRETKAHIITSELRVGSVVYQYAGTLDLIAKIGTRNIVIDWKHSIDPVRIKLQIGGYAIACRETVGIEYMFGAGVQIKESGDYSMTDIFQLRIPAMEFLSLRTCYRIKEKCKELSYQKEGHHE